MSTPSVAAASSTMCVTYVSTQSVATRDGETGLSATSVSSQPQDRESDILTLSDSGKDSVAGATITSQAGMSCSQVPVNELLSSQTKPDNTNMSCENLPAIGEGNRPIQDDLSQSSYL